MKVTTLSISNGAAANISMGQTLNMSAAKVLHVTNGDVVLDWTINVLRDEARIYQFVANDIYQGTIDQNAKTITIYVPASVDVTNIVPTIVYSDNATITPATGIAQDFSQPVTYTVTNNTAVTEYTVTVIAIDKAKALFIGAASSMDDLDPEAKAACTWMMSNVEGTLYASFADLHAGTIDLSECKIMWWHYHKDGGVDGHDQFVANAPEALEAKNEIRQFYENGGALFLTRYATNLASFIGVTGDDEWTTPNNCWGQDEDKAELCGGPWEFRIWDGQTGHAMFQDTPPMPVTTSPTLPPNTISVRTGETTPTMPLGRLAPVEPSSVSAVTVPSSHGSILPTTARVVSSVSAPAATTGTLTPSRLAMWRTSTRT